MKNLSLQSLLKPLIPIFKQYHLTIFIVFIVGGLGFAVFSFTQLLGEAATDTTYTTPISAGAIDQVTLDRLNALQTSQDAVQTLELPEGRFDPFLE